jgi:phosphatidylserine/phosphatidylglycerophosphate/cardiolipin synthase-like enzyme
LQSRLHSEAPTHWRTALATRAHVVIDAAEYFEAVREAMLNAQHRIMLIGWDFDTRISLSKTRRKKGDPPARLGDFILWLANRNPDLDIRIVKWNFGALKALGRGMTIVDIARWAIHPRIKFKLDSAHPLVCSHHQKIVVIDDIVAVCGGIDMTKDRWDMPEHLDDDPRRKQPNGKPYGPWHDVTMIVEGEAAAALGELGRDRWVTAGGDPLKPCPPSSGSPWPERVDAEFHDVQVAISRTRAGYHDVPEVREIESLFLEHIARAKHFIYAENQYFASRKIAEAIVARLSEEDPPEIVIVAPESADGWLEQKAMDSARAELIRAIGAKDHKQRFAYYCPYTAGGTPIYVHAKLLIIDDQILRIGSANMNNRSLGLDSECDVTIIDADSASRAVIARLRRTLIAEHTGLPLAEVTARLDRGEAMQSVIDSGNAQGRMLHRLKLAELDAVEETLARNALLDPERPEELFEPFATPGLFRTRRLNPARR